MNATANDEIPMNDERRTERPGGRSIARWLAAGIATVFLVGALPAVAAAADYCVAPNTSCGGTNVASLQGALDQAATTAEPDRVILGATIYPAPDPAGFSYYQASSPVEIVGQGAGQTILTSPAGGGDQVVSLFGGAGSSIHDLTIRLPFQSVSGLAGLRTGNTARRIEVIEHQTQSQPRVGVALEDGGTLEDSSVTLGSVGTSAVRFGTGGGTVHRSALSARIAVWSGYGGTIERSRLTGARAGVLADRNLTAVTGSLIRVTAANGAGMGIEALTTPGFHTSVHADGVTIAGPGEGFKNIYGVGVSNETAVAESADIKLTNAIIREVARALYAGTSGAGHATLSASYSDYDPSGNLTDGAPLASITEANVSNAGDAGFVDAAAGDYHLLPASPLVDAGDPGTAQGLDLDGNPLVADGNGDGTARRDPGAFELPATGGGELGGGSGGQPAAPPAADTQAPLISGFRATPSLFAIARKATPLAAGMPRGTRFRYTLSEPAKVTLKIQRKVAGSRTRYRTIGTLTRSAPKGANSTRFSGRLRKRALRPGRYRVRITAADTADNRSAPRTARFRVAAS
jgi:hypothetical protein